MPPPQDPGIAVAAPGPTCQQVAAKACIEIIAMLGMVMPMAYIYVIAAHFEPYKRGFFCDDQNLKHPYREQTVPIAICFVIWAFISVFFILLVETLRALAEKGREKPIKNNPTPWIAVELYRHFGYFVLGALSCLLFTELAKYTIGRLRPHFLVVCNPDLTDELCKENGFMKFVELDNEELVCRGLQQRGNFTIKELHEARLSFLSGHSSFSFFCATYLVVYLQARLANFPHSSLSGVRITYRVLKILRPFIQFGLIILAFWIALTRISDYFHHPMDVVAGGLVGILFATLSLLVCADIFNKRSAFWTAYRYAHRLPEKCNHALCEKLMDKRALPAPDDLRFVDEDVPSRGGGERREASTRPERLRTSQSRHSVGRSTVVSSASSQRIITTHFG